MKKRVAILFSLLVGTALAAVFETTVIASAQGYVCTASPPNQACPGNNGAVRDNLYDVGFVQLIHSQFRSGELSASDAYDFARSAGHIAELNIVEGEQPAPEPNFKLLMALIFTAAFLHQWRIRKWKRNV